MSSERANGTAAAAASDVPPSLENDACLIGTASSPDIHQAEAQNHKRGISGSSSIYFDTSETARTGYDLSPPPSSTSRDPNLPNEMNDLLEHSGSDEAVDSSVQGSLQQSGGVYPGDILSGSQTSRLIGSEGIPHAPYDRQYPTSYSVPGAQIDIHNNHHPTRSNTTNANISGSLSPGVPAFGAQGNAGEDRSTWERIQEIGGKPAPTNYSSRQAVPSAMDVVQGPRTSENRSARSSNTFDGTGSNDTSAQSGRLRVSVDDGSPSSASGTSIHASQPSHSFRSQAGQHHASAAVHPEVVVPRWQPDAEVTFCPICSTQFNFFIRKHHCRKCGRVVCNACSPHRITIPYQFIVQPPSEITTLNSPNSRTRPVLDSARAGSSSEFESLGGGERVRLCNPCVPDPNTAPPQTPSPSSRSQQRSSPISTHIRSSSTAAVYASSSGGLSSSTPLERQNAQFQFRSRRPRQPSILGRQFPNLPPQARDQQDSTFSAQSTSSENGSSDQAPRDSRYRASTVSHGGVRPRLNAQGEDPALPTPNRLPVPSYRTRSIISPAERHSRPLPHLPRTQRIAEEDECPVCHEELPSSQLPDSEELRAAHITSCIENAMQGTSSPRPPPQTANTSPLLPSTPGPSNVPSSSSAATPTLAPIANTPEARVAAREQAHAAVVFGQTSSAAPSYHRRTGVFPYKATEKDCVDDAECTICLEEFEVGQDMGRLECFCRFHLHCIKSWFENHYGQCPVHHQPT